MDHQDGYLPDSMLVWESDRDGIIGRGNSFEVDTLSRNTHIITLTGSIPSRAYWDTMAGNYCVETYDDLEDKYWAYSPRFGPVSGYSSISIEFDVMCEHGDRGAYPGVYLYDAEPAGMNARTKTFQLSFDWTDQIDRRIRARDKDQRNIYTSTQRFSDNTWYHFELNYDGLVHEGDIIITEVESGDIYFERENILFDLDDFSYPGMGYYGRPDYGNEWSPVRIDNIETREWNIR